VKDDPGPWSVAAPVYQGRGGRPDRRRAAPPAGLVLSPPPQVPLQLTGLDPGASVAGAGKIEVFGGLRESARAMRFIESDTKIEAIGPLVVRVWTLDNLAYAEEVRPDEDPAAGIAPPVPAEDLAGDLPHAVSSPDGSLLAMPVRERGGVALAILRAEDRSVVRWIRGALSAAWSSDGRMIAIGGDWGAVVARHVPQ
jgi:hypothetical protein